MAESRDERRRKAREAERRRHEEIDKVLEEPRHPAFEAPASGTIVESSTPPRTEERDRDGEDPG